MSASSLALSNRDLVSTELATLQTAGSIGFSEWPHDSLATGDQGGGTVTVLLFHLRSRHFRMWIPVARPSNQSIRQFRLESARTVAAVWAWTELSKRTGRSRRTRSDDSCQSRHGSNRSVRHGDSELDRYREKRIAVSTGGVLEIARVLFSYVLTGRHPPPDSSTVSVSS